ncbi:MAG TPA: hypothetical protein VJ852_02940 [Gemmatimonadaceae bacterium]|nr:hypothetical protein [Gemmatimonadaceae bacterium]
MSNPRDRGEGANPHPSSSHRTPSEIAEDEAGPIGGDGYRRDARVPANNGPVEKVRGATEEAPPRKHPTGPT